MKAEELKRIADKVHDDKAAARADAETKQYNKIINDAMDICGSAAKRGEYHAVVYYCLDEDLKINNIPSLVIQRVLETLTKKGLNPKLEYKEERVKANPYIVEYWNTSQKTIVKRKYFIKVSW